MAAYGGVQTGAHVVFPFAEALPAARDLWALARAVRSAQERRHDGIGDAAADWTGPHHDSFVRHMADEMIDALTTAEALEARARLIAGQWAQAYGQENRVLWAEWVDREIGDDGFLENVAEWITGEDDYGDPPADPAVPAPPEFAKTSPDRDFHPGG